MSTRVTQVGADVVFPATNLTRTTQVGADVVFDVSNSGRITQLGATVVFVEQTAQPFSYATVVI